MLLSNLKSDVVCQISDWFFNSLLRFLANDKLEDLFTIYFVLLLAVLVFIKN